MMKMNEDSVVFWWFFGLFINDTTIYRPFMVVSANRWCFGPQKLKFQEFGGFRKCLTQECVHPRNLTCPLQRDQLKKGQSSSKTPFLVSKAPLKVWQRQLHKLIRRSL